MTKETLSLNEAAEYLNTSPDTLEELVDVGAIPAGKIGKDTFQWTETAIPSPRSGEVLVRTRMLSLDPANRAWMMG